MLKWSATSPKSVQRHNSNFIFELIFVNDCVLVKNLSYIYAVSNFQRFFLIKPAVELNESIFYGHKASLIHWADKTSTNLKIQTKTHKMAKLDFNINGKKWI